MANITETSTFDPNVYQIATTDLVVGGPSGIANLQAQALADRTRYLFNKIGNRGAMISLTTSGGLIASQAGSLIVLQGASSPTVILPSAVTGAPLAFDLINVTTDFSPWTVSSAAGSFYGADNNFESTITLKYMESATCISDGINWAVFGHNSGAEQPQFDSSSRWASTSFVQRALGNFKGLKAFSLSGALVAGDVGSYVTFFGSTAGQTISLPQVSSTPAGAAFSARNIASVPVTIACYAGDIVITFSGAPSSFILQPGEFVVLVNQGSGNVWDFLASSQGVEQPQFDNTNRLATTSFVQRALGNRQGVLYESANNVLAQWTVGCCVELEGATAPFTTTLPAATGVAGSDYIFWNNTIVNQTLNGGGDNFDGGIGSGAATFTIPPNGVVHIVSDGYNWVPVASSFTVTQPQFDSSTKVSDTAFVQRALGNLSSYTVINTSPFSPSGYGMAYYFVNPSSVVNLPNGASLPAGASFYVSTIVALTVNAYSGQAIDNRNNGGTASISMISGDDALFIWTGSDWLTILGSYPMRAANIWATQTYAVAQATGAASAAQAAAISAAETYASGVASTAQLNAQYYALAQANSARSDAEAFATSAANSAQANAESWVTSNIQSLVSGCIAAVASAAGFVFSNGTNGYLKLPSWLGGFIFQWGYGNTGSSGFTTVYFPITFSSNAFFAIATSNSAPAMHTYTTSGLSNSSVVFHSWFANTSIAPSDSFSFFAIGN